MQGHIHKRVHTGKNGKQTTRWYVVVDVGTDAGGRRQQKWHGGFWTRKEAEIARAKLVDDLHTGSYVMPDRLTFREWIRDSWLPMTEARVKPSTFHSYKRNLEVHVLPVIGSRPIQQLTPLMLNALYARLQSEGRGHGPLSAKTVRYIHTTIHKALGACLSNRNRSEIRRFRGYKNVSEGPGRAGEGLTERHVSPSTITDPRS
jgi:hypothetical protein